MVHTGRSGHKNIVVKGVCHIDSATTALVSNKSTIVVRTLLDLLLRFDEKWMRYGKKTNLSLASLSFTSLYIGLTRPEAIECPDMKRFLVELSV
eukprot:scaffold10860_cov182-Amphora_coffeaeformis.AAC.4